MFQEGLENGAKAPKISVVIRKRPRSQKEIARNDIDIVECRQPASVIVKEMKQKVDLTKYIEEHHFNFDYAFGETSTNQQIYSACVESLVESVFSHTNVTCFAYGQTGSGKTHTMLGNYQKGNPGLYLLASSDMFQYLARPEYKHLTVWVSFYEIYCGKLFDLLNERAELQCREDAKKKVNIVGLQEKKIHNVQSILDIIEFGNQVRVTGVNSANSESSRSHAILAITLRENNNTFGKLSFIDLAGSERGADVSDSNKQTRLDGAEINKSLLALKECIRAIDQNKNHTPFRGSKLTQVLRDSFVGNCKTVMIGNISPCQTNSENSLNTLRYADRVKELKKPNNSELNQKVSDLEKELMLPRQNNNTRKYNVPNENACIDYTKQAPPANRQPDQSNLFNQGQNNLPNLQTNQQQQQQGGSLNNLNLVQNGSAPVQPTSNTQLGMNNNSTNNLNNNVMNKLQNQFNNKKRVSQPQTQNLFGNSPMQNQPLVNNTTNQGNVMNSNNLGQMSYSNNNQQQMELEGEFQKQNGSGVYQPGGNLQDKKAPLQQSNLNQHLQNNFLKNPSNVTTMQGQMNNGNQQFGQQPGVNPQYKENNPISMSIEQIKNWKANNEQDLQVISQKHEELISQILAEEEDVIAGHRSHIDDCVELVKKEMMLLHEVDKPGSDVDEYVKNLDGILLHKINIIADLRKKLATFTDHLKEEEVLSKKFYEQRSQILDVFNLNQANPMQAQNVTQNDEMNLLDDNDNY